MNETNNDTTIISVEDATQKIFQHNKAKEDAYKKKINDQNNELADLKHEIRNLKPRIENIIKIGNLCHKNNIPMRKYGTYSKCRYDEDAYETDAIYHQLGFYPNPRGNRDKEKYTYIGYIMGGACGNKDFITNGEIIINISHHCDKINLSNKNDNAVLLKHCRKFIIDFPKFEKVFYEFIEKL